MMNLEFRIKLFIFLLTFAISLILHSTFYILHSLAVESGSSRPYPCDPAYQTLPGPVSSFCADQLQVKDEVTYYQNEGQTITKNWGGQVEVDLSQTELPLAGKTDLTFATTAEEDQYRLENYLADYFEGTTFSDQEPIDLTGTDLNKIKEDLKRVLISGGVFSKLATKEQQDRLRENMVKRALGLELRWPGSADPVHDYVVCYVKSGAVVSPTEPGSEPIRLSDFASHLRPQRADFTDAETGDKQYYYALKNWQKSAIKGVVLPRLWLYIPLFSREDVPGNLNLKLDKKDPADSLTLTSGSESQKIKLPHLARLKEVSGEIAKILSPLAQKFTAGRQPLIAQPQNFPQTFGEVLSLSDSELKSCDWEKYSLQNAGDSVCGQTITADLSATEVFENPNFRPIPTPTKPPYGYCDRWDILFCVVDSDCDKFESSGDQYGCYYNCCLEEIEPESGVRPVSREIDVNVKIPFLDSIWQNAVSGTQSIFKIFFPHDPEFDFADYDYPGMADITYRYYGTSPKAQTLAGTGKSGNQAKIYFEHLGGVRCIRDKVLQRLLPAQLGFQPQCPAEKIGLPSLPSPQCDAPPETCSWYRQRNLGEIIPSCIICGDILFCYGNDYRLCPADSFFPQPNPGVDSWSDWASADRWPDQEILYNGLTYQVPAGGVYGCDSNVFGCSNWRCSLNQECAN